MTRVLGIETSCDETGVAVVEDGRRIIAAEVASQVPVHARFGGVVPEIASRQHTLCISRLVERVTAAAGDGIEAIAVTAGPGLLGSLFVGVSFAKGLAYACKRPLVPVHHIEGHIFAPFLSDDPPEFPFLALVVSGGHTNLIDCTAPHHYEILGRTRDDAVGESFDKVARLLGLSYPGGPAIEQAAREGNPEAVDFPRGMIQDDSLDFSYSGLKTAVLYRIREEKDSVPDLAASFQHAAVDALIIKTKRAIERTGTTRLVVAGGVAANQRLRERLSRELHIKVHLPSMDLCIDNGAMIAAAGHSRLQAGLLGDLRTTPNPSLPLA